MKRFFLAALLLFAAVAFTGCDNDDDDLYDTLSGRVWAGDLGFYQDGRIPLDISYGRADYPRELRNVYIRRGRLTGELFIDGQYYDRITLYMQ